MNKKLITLFAMTMLLSACGSESSNPTPTSSDLTTTTTSADPTTDPSTDPTTDPSTEPEVNNAEIEVSNTNCVVTLDKEAYEVGETVSFTVAADSNCYLVSVKANDVELTANDGVYSFVALEENAIVAAASLHSLSLIKDGVATSIYTEAGLGSTVQLSAVTGLEGAQVTWQSNDTSAATVSETGLVTFAHVAQATTVKITATVKDTTIADTIEFTVQPNTWFDGVVNRSFIPSTMTPYRLAMNQDYYTDVWGVRTDDGYYLYAEQYNKVTREGNSSTEWWVNDNIEYRIRPIYDSAVKSDTQIWVSNFNDGAARETLPAIGGGGTGTESVLDAATGLYKCAFEVFVPNASEYVSDILPEDEAVLEIGVACENGWYASQGWYNGIPMGYGQFITADGIVDKENVADGYFVEANKSTTELLSKSVKSHRQRDFNVGTGIVLKGTGNFQAIVKAHSTNDATEYYEDVANAGDYTKAPAANASFCADINSPNWTNGGWSTTADWWGWGPWNEGAKENNSGNQFYADGATFEGFRVGHIDENLEMLVGRQGSFVYIMYRVMANVGPNVNKYVYVNLVSSRINYDGEILVNLGSNNMAEVTYTSAKVVKGSVVLDKVNGTEIE